MNKKYLLLKEKVEDIEVRITNKRSDELPSSNKEVKEIPRQFLRDVQPKALGQENHGTRPVYRSSGEGETSVAQSLSESRGSKTKEEKEIEKSSSKIFRALKKTGYPVRKLLREIDRAKRKLSRLADSDRVSARKVKKILDDHFSPFLPPDKELAEMTPKARQSARLKVVYTRLLILALILQSVLTVFKGKKVSKEVTYKIADHVLTAIIPSLAYQIAIQSGQKIFSRAITVISVILKAVGIFKTSRALKSKAATVGIVGAMNMAIREIQILLIDYGYSEAALSITTFLTGISQFIEGSLVNTE